MLELHLEEVGNVQSVDQSTWQYIRHHGWLYIVTVLTVAILLIYLVPAFRPQIGILGLFALVFGYGLVRTAVQQEFMKEFGQSLGYNYTPTGDLTSVQGKIFSLGHDQVISGLLTGTYHNIPNRIYNYTFVVGEGKSRRTYTYTIFEATFQNNMPDIVLAAREGIFSMLPWKGNWGEHIELEGDFNKYFRLSVPKNYGTEAYEIFTPDVMATLIDKAQGLNFEFNGNRLYIYLAGIISTKEKMQSMFDLVDYLIDLFNKSTRGVNLTT